MKIEPAPIPISMIIVSWNTSALLAGCLQSIADTCHPSRVEVWVVDNASSDGSAQMVARDFPWVHLIASPENLGFGKANNLAYPHTRGELVLLLNPDTLLRPGAVISLAHYLEEHPQVGAIGPRILSPDGSIQASVHPMPTLLREAWRLFHLDRLYSISQYPAHFFTSRTPRPVDVIMGSCMLIRRCVLEQTGLFDEQFFIYSEEVDLCERIRKAGWPIHFVPEVEIIHFGGQSTSQIADQMFMELYRNKVKLFRKHAGPATAAAYKSLLWWVAQSRILGGVIANRLPGANQKALREKARQYRMLISERKGL